MSNEVWSIPAAAACPRMSGGVLKWYEGDVFDLQVQIELTDERGEVLPFEAEHTVTFVFRDRCRRVVCELCYTGIENNTVTVRITEPLTALFPAGSYTYDVIYEGVGRRTLARNAPILVE